MYVSSEDYSMQLCCTDDGGRLAETAIQVEVSNHLKVMNSVSRFIVEKLGLKVNREKSRVSRPSKLKFLGFGFYKIKKLNQLIKGGVNYFKIGHMKSLVFAFE